MDDNLDLRKAAFEFMYTLLDTCVDRLDIFEFLSHVQDGLKDHYDINMLTYLMVARVSQVNQLITNTILFLNSNNTVAALPRRRAAEAGQAGGAAQDDVHHQGEGQQREAGVREAGRTEEVRS